MPFAEWEAQQWEPQMAKYDKIFKRVGFLTSTYMRRYWWFESLVTIYKLSMTVLVMFVSDGDENKILFGMLGATVMMGVFSFYQPFRHRDILSINTGAQLVVLLVLFAAMFLLVNESGGGSFFAVALVCLTLAPLVAGVVLTLRLPKEATAREAGDALSKDLSDAVKAKLLGSFRKKKKEKKTSLESVANASDWCEHTDEDGNVYFYRESTGESSWERPGCTASETTPPRSLRALRSAVSSVRTMLVPGRRTGKPVVSAAEDFSSENPMHTGNT